jgi:hypothetical protein
MCGINSLVQAFQCFISYLLIQWLPSAEIIYSLCCVLKDDVRIGKGCVNLLCFVIQVVVMRILFLYPAVGSLDCYCPPPPTAYSETSQVLGQRRAALNINVYEFIVSVLMSVNFSVVTHLLTSRSVIVFWCLSPFDDSVFAYCCILHSFFPSYG